MDVKTVCSPQIRNRHSRVVNMTTRNFDFKYDPEMIHLPISRALAYLLSS
jgi:hypothetical protein